MTLRTNVTVLNEVPQTFKTGVVLYFQWFSIAIVNKSHSVVSEVWSTWDAIVSLASRCHIIWTWASHSPTCTWEPSDTIHCLQMCFTDWPSENSGLVSVRTPNVRDGVHLFDSSASLAERSRAFLCNVTWRGVQSIIWTVINGATVSYSHSRLACNIAAAAVPTSRHCPF